VTLKAILFDLDDTLLWDDRSVKEAFIATCKTAQQHYPQLNPHDLEMAVREQALALYTSFETYSYTKMIGINAIEALWGRFQKGNNSHLLMLRSLVPYYRKESWTRGLLALGIDDSKLGESLGELFPQERRARPYTYELTFPTLNYLKGAYKLLLLTNGCPDLQEEKIAGVPQLAAFFDHILISGVYGEGKPAQSIFQHALKLLQIEAADALMVGDKLTTDILGSLGVGMRNVWINHHHIKRTEEIIPTYEISDLSQLPDIIELLS